jgi:hypothetical protein
MQGSRYRSLLRSAFSAIVDSGLSASEIRALADELRRGQLADELALMLEKVSSHFSEKSKFQAIAPEIEELEHLVRTRKVSRSRLANVLHSFGYMVDPARKGTTIQSMLREFAADSTPREVAKLKDILQAPGIADPYLKGIEKTRS